MTPEEKLALADKCINDIDAAHMDCAGKLMAILAAPTLQATIDSYQALMLYHDTVAELLNDYENETNG